MSLLKLDKYSDAFSDAYEVYHLILNIYWLAHSKEIFKK